MRLSRRWQERLHPWRTIARQHERIGGLNDAILAQQRLLDQRAARLDAQQREMRLAAGTAGFSVGWEQAGAVTPEFVIVGTGRGSQGGVRVYASRELAGTAIRLVPDPDAPQALASAVSGKWKLEAILGRAIVSNEPDRDKAVEHVMTIFRNQERAESEAAEKLAAPGPFLDGGSHRTTGDG